jgi:hypothetical protein
MFQTRENKNQNGFLKSISSDDVETIVDATGTEKIKQINFTINKQSTHYQNSIVAKILSITDEKLIGRLRDKIWKHFWKHFCIRQKYFSKKYFVHNR